MLIPLIIVAILTPWFWFAPLPKDLFNAQIATDIQKAKQEVVWERGKVKPSIFNPLFLNWPTEFATTRLTYVFENLDIGNYFFVGHPRERVGIKEIQKFTIVHLALFVIGLTSIEFKKYKKVWLAGFCILLVFTFLFKWRTAEQSLAFAYFLVWIMAMGVKEIIQKWRKST